MRTADLASGFVLMGLGLAAALGSRAHGAAAGVLGPGVLPAWVGWALAWAGAALAAGAWWRGDRRPVEWPGGAGARRLLVVLAATVAYVAFLEPLGFPLASLAYVAFLAWYLGDRRPLPSLAWGILAGAGVWLFAVRLLGLPFPSGPLPGVG